MIKRELYMSRIRPFIGTELVKVMTGIRRCGKSVMLELIQQELAESGVSRAQFISINFEDMSYSHLQTAQALHDEITARAAEIEGKVYLFFDEIQEVKDWEKCINSLRVSLDCDIYITGSSGSSWSCTAQLPPMRPSSSVSKSICLPEGCPTSQTSAMQMLRLSNIFMICSTLSNSRTS